MAEIEQRFDRVARDQVWSIRLTEYDIISWDRERLNMLQDALWLAELTMVGERTGGPLSLPRTRLPVRLA